MTAPAEPPRSARSGPLSDDAFLTRAEAWALVGSQPLAQLSNMALLPALGAMRVDLGLSYGELGVVVAAFGLARLAADLPAGGLARRWNPRGVLLVAFAVSALVSGLGVLASTGWQVAGVRVLIGLASAVAQAMILVWLVGGAGRAARGRVMARGEALFSVVGLVTPAVSGLLAAELSWRVAFVIGAVAAAIGFVAVLLFTRPAGAARAAGLPASAVSATPGRRSGWRDVRVGGRVLLAAYVTTFVVFFCRNGLLNAVVPVLGTDRIGLEPLQIGVLFSTINALSIGAVLLGGRAGDRFGRFQLLAPGLAILLGSQLLLFLANDPVSYVVIGLIQGFSFFVNPLPPGLLGDALPAHARAQGIAVYRAVSDLALLSAPALMGAALQLGGFPAAELASVTVIALALGVVTTLAARRSAS